MTIVSLNIKEKIIYNINEIINYQDQDWSNLDIDIKIKIIHNLCSQFKNNELKNSFNNFLNIPLKSIRPKKLIQICEINKKNNLDIFEEYKKSILNYTINFRNNYNSKKKYYSYSNISKDNYNEILNNYNFLVYNFLNININIINHNLFFNNLVSGNQHKLIYPINNIKHINIKFINYKDNYLIIEFNNNIKIEMELFLTSEKITGNIPAKYKINLINIF